MDPISLSSILSLLSSAGAAGVGAAGAGPLSAAEIGALTGAAGSEGALSTASSALGPGPATDRESSLMSMLRGAGNSFERELARNQDYFYEPPKEGQKNASGSNASLDNALGSDARKTLGVSEGGATPQLDNTISRDLIGIKRTPTATQTVAPKEEGLFTKLSNWWNGLGK